MCPKKGPLLPIENPAEKPISPADNPPSEPVIHEAEVDPTLENPISPAGNPSPSESIIHKVEVDTLPAQNPVCDPSQLVWTGFVDVSSYVVEGKEEQLSLMESDNELEIGKEEEEYSAEKNIEIKYPKEKTAELQMTEFIASDLSDMVPPTKIDTEDEFKVSEPPVKRQKLSSSPEELAVNTDQILIADDGAATLLQRLPEECAREHALVPNIPTCHSQFHQLNPNDRSSPPPESGGDQVLQTAEGVLKKQSPLGCTKQTVLEPFSAMLTSSDNQLVPKENWEPFFGNQSFYVDTSKDVKFTSEIPEETTVVSVTPSSKESTKESSLDCQLPFARHTAFSSPFPSSFEPTSTKVPIQPGMFNLSKPRLRLGLSKNQKCRPLHKN